MFRVAFCLQGFTGRARGLSVARTATGQWSEGTVHFPGSLWLAFSKDSHTFKSRSKIKGNLGSRRAAYGVWVLSLHSVPLTFSGVHKGPSIYHTCTLQQRALLLCGHLKAVSYPLNPIFFVAHHWNKRHKRCTHSITTSAQAAGFSQLNCKIRFCVIHWASRRALFISMWQDSGHEMDMGNSGVDFILSLVSGLARDPVRRQLIIGWNPSRRRCWFNLVCVCVILTPCLALIGPYQTWSTPWAPEAHSFKECGGINPERRNNSL